MVGLCVYIIAAPLLPNLTFWWNKSIVKNSPPLVAAAENPEQTEAIPAENTLVIPRLNLQQPIHSGNRWEGLKKGVWQNTHASSPGDGFNTVLMGHRFTYGGPAVFYHLDKVQTGDKIIVYWQQQKYEYVVDEIIEVPPTAVEVEQKDVGREQLTIYTCTPLVTAKNRLVIKAIPEGGGGA